MERPSGPVGVGLGLRSRYLEAVCRGAADEAVDFFEVSPENFMHRGGRSTEALRAIAQRRPILSHGLMMSLGGADPLSEPYMDTLRGFLEAVEAPWHSDHLCFSTHGGVVLHDLLPIPFQTKTARHVAARVREAADRLERPMAVENISWYAHAGAATLDEAEFIAEVCDRADCWLLLDVNNCLVNAKNHGFDVMAWLAKVPLDRVIQIHVAGHERFDDALYVDTHGAPVEPAVYDLLAWVVERTGPVPVLLERDNNFPPLGELLDELQRIRARYEQALSRREAGKQGRPVRSSGRAGRRGAAP